MNKEKFDWEKFYKILSENAKKVYSKEEWNNHILVVDKNIRSFCIFEEKYAIRINFYERLSLGIAHDLIEDYEDVGRDCIYDSFEKSGLQKSILTYQDNLDYVFIKTLEILTRQKNEWYFDYIDRILSSGDKKVLIVKLCDLEANIGRATEDGSRLQKYLFAHEKIWHALKEIERKEKIKTILKIG